MLLCSQDQLQSNLHEYLLPAVALKLDQAKYEDYQFHVRGHHFHYLPHQRHSEQEILLV